MAIKLPSKLRLVGFYFFTAVAVLGPTAPAHAACGDGKQEFGEECDDGNFRNFDGCSSACKKEIVCFVDPNYGPIVRRDAHTCLSDSECDPGESCVTTMGCWPSLCGCGTDGAAGRCTMDCKGVCAPCGDGQKTPNEECDDGNRVDGDGCSSTCKVEKQKSSQASQPAPIGPWGLMILPGLGLLFGVRSRKA